MFKDKWEKYNNDVLSKDQKLTPKHHYVVGFLAAMVLLSETSSMKEMRDKINDLTSEVMEESIDLVISDIEENGR